MAVPFDFKPVGHHSLNMVVSGSGLLHRACVNIIWGLGRDTLDFHCFRDSQKSPKSPIITKSVIKSHSTTHTHFIALFPRYPAPTTTYFPPHTTYSAFTSSVTSPSYAHHTSYRQEFFYITSPPAIPRTSVESFETDLLPYGPVPCVSPRNMHTPHKGLAYSLLCS